MFHSNLQQRFINTHVVHFLSNFDNFLDCKNYKIHAWVDYLGLRLSLVVTLLYSFKEYCYNLYFVDVQLAHQARKWGQWGILAVETRLLPQAWQGPLSGYQSRLHQFSLHLGCQCRYLSPEQYHVLIFPRYHECIEICHKLHIWFGKWWWIHKN